MQSSEFLQTARDLLLQNNPASNRSAVSRAYYAVYNSGINFLMNLGVPNLNGHKVYHDDLTNCLTFSENAELKEISTTIGNLRIARNNADYLNRNINDSEGSKFAEMQIAIAEEIMKTYKNFNLNDQIKTHLKQKIMHKRNIKKNGLP